MYSIAIQDLHDLHVFSYHTRPKCRTICSRWTKQIFVLLLSLLLLFRMFQNGSFPSCLSPLIGLSQAGHEVFLSLSTVPSNYWRLRPQPIVSDLGFDKPFFWSVLYPLIVSLLSACLRWTEANEASKSRSTERNRSVALPRPWNNFDNIIHHLTCTIEYMITRCYQESPFHPHPSRSIQNQVQDLGQCTPGSWDRLASSLKALILGRARKQAKYFANWNKSVMSFVWMYISRYIYI